MTPAAREGAPRPLSGSRRFAAVRGWRAHATAGLVRVAAAPNPVGVARIGYATGGVRLAVDRNRLRRRLREAARPQGRLHPGIDFIVSAGQPAVAAPFASIAADTVRAMSDVAAKVARRMTQAR